MYVFLFSNYFLLTSIPTNLQYPPATTLIPTYHHYPSIHTSHHHPTLKRAHMLVFGFATVFWSPPPFETHQRPGHHHFTTILRNPPATTPNPKTSASLVFGVETAGRSPPLHHHPSKSTSRHTQLHCPRAGPGQGQPTFSGP